MSRRVRARKPRPEGHIGWRGWNFHVSFSSCRRTACGHGTCFDTFTRRPWFASLWPSSSNWLCNVTQFSSSGVIYIRQSDFWSSFRCNFSSPCWKPSRPAWSVSWPCLRTSTRKVIGWLENKLVFAFAVRIWGDLWSEDSFWWFWSCFWSRPRWHRMSIE